MDFRLDENIGFDSAVVSLDGLRPVVNGVPLQGTHVEIDRNEGGRTRLRYTASALAGGSFGIEITRESADRHWLRYWTEGLDGRSLDSFGIRFERLSNLRAFLRNGYYSWDGSAYVGPQAMSDWEEYEARPETGYALTQLLPLAGTGGVIVGFDRHDRFQQTFTVDTRACPPSLTIQTLWDRKALAPGSLATGQVRCESERLVIFEHAGVEEGLRQWARIVAAAAPVPPRRSLPITGWCSWYNLYAYIDEQVILEHLRGVAAVTRRENLPARVFQIDDGFTPEMGDWLEVKPAFPRGIKPLLDDIRAAGFTPGLWIAPFMVGNRSHLYRDHPDWVVQDARNGGPLVQRRFYGEFRWHKRSEEYYILDMTHPAAFDYLRTVFRTWRNDWGCEYFKTDFMEFGSEHGPERAVWQVPGQSRIEIWRRVAEMIRSEIGAATWLGSGCALWASVGLVDGIRIGTDVGVEWRGHLSAQSLLRDQATRNFANHILWQTDPDCVLLRERFHLLGEAEQRSLAIYAGMTGGVLMTSDALDELSPERLRLWKLLLQRGPDPGPCRFPFLGQSHITYTRLPADLYSHRVRHEPAADPVLVSVRGNDQASAIFVFNTGDAPVQRTYALPALGLMAPSFIYDWTAGRALPAPLDRVSVELAAHDGALLFAGPSPILAAPEQLP